MPTSAPWLGPSPAAATSDTSPIHRNPPWPISPAPSQVVATLPQAIDLAIELDATGPLGYTPKSALGTSLVLGRLWAKPVAA